MKIIELDDFKEGTEILAKLYDYFGGTPVYQNNKIVQIKNCHGSEIVQILFDSGGSYINVTNNNRQNRVEIVEFLINT